MPHQAYIVKQGDTLWDIPKVHLGNPNRWRELYEYNNTLNITGKTGLRIIDPDLIFVGQKLFIPNDTPVRGAPTRPSAKPRPIPSHASSGSLKAKLKVRNIPLKYDLNSLPSITISSLSHIATIRLKGSVTLQSTESISFTTLSQNGFQVAAKMRRTMRLEN